MTSSGLTAVRDTIPATAPLNKNLAVVASCHAHWNPQPTLFRNAYHKATSPPLRTNSYDDEAAISAEEPNDDAAATADTVDTVDTDAAAPPRTDVVLVVGEDAKPRRLRRWCGPGKDGRDGTAAASTPHNNTPDVDDEEEAMAAVATSRASANALQRGFITPPGEEAERPAPTPWDVVQEVEGAEARLQSRGRPPLTVLVELLVILLVRLVVMFAGPMLRSQSTKNKCRAHALTSTGNWKVLGCGLVSEGTRGIDNTKCVRLVVVLASLRKGSIDCAEERRGRWSVLVNGVVVVTKSCCS